MPQTLAGAKPKLEKDLEKILYDALYEAIMTSAGGDGPVAAVVKSQLEVAAKKQADKFSKTAAADMATAIHDFVKEIGIMLSNPSTLISTSIMSPSPVTGVVPITGFTVT